MLKVEANFAALIIATGIVFALHSDVAGVEVRVDFDKTFDFTAARTWAWNPEGAGVVRMARTLTTHTSSQTVGQFLPATTMWGLPPFPQATQPLEMMNRGALVLDFSAHGKIVWRGVGEADIKFDIDDTKHESLLREGVRDLLGRYPPKT